MERGKKILEEPEGAECQPSREKKGPRLRRRREAKNVCQGGGKEHPLKERKVFPEAARHLYKKGRRINAMTKQTGTIRKRKIGLLAEREERKKGGKGSITKK